MSISLSRLYFISNWETVQFPSKHLTVLRKKPDLLLDRSPFSALCRSFSKSICPMKTLIPPKIVLTVELGPELLRRKEHAWPVYTPENHAQAVDSFWRAFLADAGIVDVKPVVLGEWHVSALEMTDEMLQILIHNHIFIGLEEYGEEEDQSGSTPTAARDRATWADLDWDLFISLSGGFYWLDGEQVLFKPQCCSDLSNYQDWLRILDLEEAENCSIWIGHPSLPCRRVGDRIQFAKYSDANPPFPESCFCFEIGCEDFRLLAAEMTGQMQQFQRRIIDLLTKMQAPEPERLADTLCPIGKLMDGSIL
jgi:hypothetical protein